MYETHKTFHCFSKVIYACIYILIAVKTKIWYAALVYPNVKMFAKTIAISLAITNPGFEPSPFWLAAEFIKHYLKNLLNMAVGL